MRIAIATFADLPNPPSRGGAVETLIDDLCKQNENEKKIEIDVYSIYDAQAQGMSLKYKFTNFIYYQKKILHKVSVKNLVYKSTKKVLLDANMKKLVNIINLKRYDFVVITSIIRELEVILKKIQSPVIWYLHGDPISVLNKKELEKVVQKCSAIITVSNFIKKRIESIGFKCPIITVPNCADVLTLSSAEGEKVRKSFRIQNGIKESDTLISYIGRITPIKGILELINAFVANNAENMKLIIVGMPSNDDEKAYYEKLRKNSNENIIFYGYANHNQLSTIYCAVDVVVVPSVCMEAAPLTIIEAMCFKKRIIATNVGGIPEYARGKNVIFVEADEYLESSLQKALIECQYLTVDLTEKELARYSTKTYYKNLNDALVELQDKR